MITLSGVLFKLCGYVLVQRFLGDLLVVSVDVGLQVRRGVVLTTTPLDPTLLREIAMRLVGMHSKCMCTFIDCWVVTAWELTSAGRFPSTVSLELSGVFVSWLIVAFFADKRESSFDICLAGSEVIF